MGRTRNLIYTIAFTLLVSTVGVQAQLNRASERQVEPLLQRLETRTDAFNTTVELQLDNGRVRNAQREENFRDYLEAFENATDELRSNFNGRRAQNDDVSNVLNYGWYINDFMSRNRLNAASVQQWNLIRTDLDTLARLYNVSWNWNQQRPAFSRGQQGQMMPVRVNEQQVRGLLQRLEVRTDAFRSNVERQMNNTRNNVRMDENALAYIEAFEKATDELRSGFDGQRVQNSDVTAVLNYGWYVNDFMSRNRLSSPAVQQWNLIRTDLNTLSNLYNVSWNWNQTLPAFNPGPMQPIRVDEQQVRGLLQRLETRTNAFRTTVERQMNNSRNNVRMDENALAYIESFEQATDNLRSSFDGRTAQNTDVTAVLNYGWYVNDFMSRIRLNAPAVQQWNLIRTDLNTLSNLYNVSWNWNQNLPAYQQYPGQWGSQQTSQIDGTYRLNVSASDNVSTVISQTISNSSVRARQQANLERRMASPQTIVIQTRGNQVRFATDYGQPVDFVADGRAVTEANNRGQQIRTTVSMTGNTLNIATDGDRANDFRVSFTPVAGNRLRVTRQLYMENQNQMITVNSVYDRVSNVAQWPTENNQPTWNNTGNGQVGNFYIPNGTRLTAVLQNQIATNVSQAGDQFTMRVTSPNQYNGAIITGRVAQAESSGRVSGRANVSMVFETIQFQNQTYQFAGIIDSAREADGDNISINNEGTVRDGNQTTQTVTRAGIGAVLGALIGAIVDGGSGAAIGAGVGAGAGAGTVLIQGRDNLRLEAGSQFTITSTGPNTSATR